MAFLEKKDFDTHIYAEYLEVITEAKDTIMTAAIDSAIAEAKSYLQKYKVAEIFAATGDNRNPLLLTFVKDITIWHLINLSTAGVDYESKEKRYNAARAWLKGVMKGDISPDLPLDESEEQVGAITMNSNTKRGNHF